MIEEILKEKGYAYTSSGWLKGSTKVQICKGCKKVKFFENGILKRQVGLKNIEQIRQHT
jgi:hypothetical protein